MLIDPKRAWAKVEERLAVETGPRRRANLETILAHMKAEAVGDIDGLPETLSRMSRATRTERRRRS